MLARYSMETLPAPVLVSRSVVATVAPYLSTALPSAAFSPATLTPLRKPEPPAPEASVCAAVSDEA